MSAYKGVRPTIGVLVGWHAYEGTLHSFLDQAFRGIQAAARDVVLPRSMEDLLTGQVVDGQVTLQPKAVMLLRAQQ